MHGRAAVSYVRHQEGGCMSEEGPKYNPKSTHVPAHVERPALRFELAYQLGYLEGTVRAFLGGYGTREGMERAMIEIQAWENERREAWENERKEVARLAGKIDATVEAK